MVTIYDVAKKTGFSSTTVSKALNNYSDVSAKTREKILKTAKEMGYTANAMAKGLRDKKSWLVGIILESDLEIGPHFLSIIESFRLEMESKGYDVIFLNKNLGNKNLNFYDHCLNRNIEGVLILSTGGSDENILTLTESEIPTVTTDNTDFETTSINCDNLGGSKSVITYLYGLGHKKIGMLAGPQDTAAGMERVNGYNLTMMELKLETNDDWFVISDKFNFNAGYNAMKEILNNEDKPTAIYASSDLMAYGAIVAITEQGYSVPEDFSIVGFDDIYSSQFYNPGLTTIKQDHKLMGRTAAEKLLQMITSKEKGNSIITPVELVIRESCRELDE